MCCIDRNNDQHVTNPTYSTDIGDINKVGFETEDVEHIYETIKCYDDEEAKEEPKSVAFSKNTNDDRASIKSDDVPFDQTREYCVPDFNVSQALSSKPKPKPKPRYANFEAIKPVSKPQHDLPTNTNLQTEDEYLLHAATQRVSDGEYASLDTKCAESEGEGDEYITQSVPQTVQSNEYTSLNVTHHITEGDYQEIVHQPPPPPGYAVPTNIPATNYSS